MNNNLASPLLEVKNIHTYYGAIHALRDVSLQVFPGEIVTLLGANGAGKTTTLHSISGLTPIKNGAIYFKGETIHHLRPHKIVAKGLSQSPEGRLVFPNLTVKENLEMGAYLRHDKKTIQSDLEFMLTLFPRLKERFTQLAQTLSGGEQQMLAIARSYMCKPQMLLLDEPSLGIAPILVQSIFKAIKEINAQGMGILLVEQNAHLALKISHRGYVMINGEITLQGKREELLSNESVKKAYLGH